MRAIDLVLGASLLTALACGGDPPPPAKGPTETTVTKPSAAPAEPVASAAPSAEPKKEEPPPPPPPPKKTSKEIISGNTFMFSLADSADAKKTTDDKCAKKAGKDEKKLDACKKEIEAAAALEGIRFDKDDKGDWWYVDFGSEKGKEVINHKWKYTVAKEEDGKITLTPSGKDMGKTPMKAMPKEVVITITNETTIVLDGMDPGKGKLTFKKK